MQPFEIEECVAAGFCYTFVSGRRDGRRGRLCFTDWTCMSDSLACIAYASRELYMSARLHVPVAAPLLSIDFCGMGFVEG